MCATSFTNLLSWFFRLKLHAIEGAQQLTLLIGFFIVGVLYSPVQWNWFSGVTGCTWISCIPWRQRTNFTTPGSTLHFGMASVSRMQALRCPETLFISYENANFLFSVFRVVQGEAKTPKIMGCCRANFAFLHALKIGTFRGKWTLEWVFKTSHFVCPALYFLFNSKLAFYLIVLNDTLRELQKDVEFRAQNSAKNNFFLLWLET